MNANGNPPPNRIFWLLQQIADYLRAPDWMVNLATGRMLRVVFDTNSAMGNVNTVATVTTVTTVTTCATTTNLTNFNTIDTRELVWSQWTNTFAAGVRRGIT